MRQLAAVIALPAGLSAAIVQKVAYLSLRNLGRREQSPVPGVVTNGVACAPLEAADAADWIQLMAVYTLPELSYDYGALEPHISARIMELHHSKHHQAYVDGANAALDKLAAARESGDFAAVGGLEKNLAFNLGGHINHSVFWRNMSPAGGEVSGDLAAAIDEYFGSFAQFQAHFTGVATTIQGSGWAVLAWDQLGKRLNLFQMYDQQANVPVGMVPLLQLDMWEHAFYLDYQNVKGSYVSAWWNVVNWDDVAARFAAARAGGSFLLP